MSETPEHDPYGLNEPVTVLDDLDVLPGCQQSLLTLFETEYQPLAKARGLHLVGQWCLPPFERPAANARVVLQWQYESLGALWQARGAEETDPALSAFWARVEPLIASRQRQLGRAGQLMQGFQTQAEQLPAGKPLPAGQYRHIAFVRPEHPVEAAEQAQWLSVIAEHSPALVSGAGFNDGGWTFRPGELTWDLVNNEPAAPAPEELLAKLPAKAVVDEVVTLGECLDSGFRNADLQGGVKRTILFKLCDGAAADHIARLEERLQEFPRLLPEIINWSVSKVAATTGNSTWHYCLEQEFAVVDDILGAYQNHPYHWAVIDRFFHPEGHERVSDLFFHSVRPLQQSLLAGIFGLK